MSEETKLHTTTIELFDRTEMQQVKIGYDFDGEYYIDISPLGSSEEQWETHVSFSKSDIRQILNFLSFTLNHTTDDA